MSSPRVWSKFSAKNAKGDVINLRITDLPKDRFEDYLDLYMNCLVKEESSFRASGIPESAEAMEELRQVRAVRNRDESFHKVICCLDNNNDEIQDIIGASTMSLETPEKMSQKETAKSAAVQKWLELYDGMMAAYDIIQEFKLERYFVARGLFVHPDYRGLGIAQEFLKVRRMICKEYGISMHGSWMTSYGTQKAAERDGWETVCEIQSDEYRKKYGVVLENGPPSWKFMVARISLT